MAMPPRDSLLNQMLPSMARHRQGWHSNIPRRCQRHQNPHAPRPQQCSPRFHRSAPRRAPHARTRQNQPPQELAKSAEQQTIAQSGLRFQALERAGLRLIANHPERFAQYLRGAGVAEGVSLRVGIGVSDGVTATLMLEGDATHEVPATRTPRQMRAAVPPIICLREGRIEFHPMSLATNGWTMVIMPPFVG